MSTAVPVDALRARAEALVRLHCPACRGMLVPAVKGTEDPWAPVHCIDCDRDFPYKKGVLDLSTVASAAGGRVRRYPRGGQSLDFYAFFCAVLQMKAYKESSLEDELYTLLGWMDPHPGRPLLVVGSGNGEMAEALFRACPGAPILACDDSLEELIAARARLVRAGIDGVFSFCCDLDALPLRDGALGSVLHWGVLHGVSEPVGHMRRLARVLPAGGRLAGVALARSILPQLAEQQEAMSAESGVRFVPMEQLGKDLMKNGWTRFRHEQPSNWMARFTALRGPEAP
jgi:ubiquinone/menaquinone biosynthesis C-methylase UbiE